jgi:hypothetical protein
MYTIQASHISEQAFRVLRRLRGVYTRGGRAAFVDAAWLANDTQMPLPSLRRSVYELRQAGFSVIHDNGRVGLMFLQERAFNDAR